MIKAILFDLDDTLYHYGPAHESGLEASYKLLKKEIKISKRKFNHLFNLSKTEVKNQLAGTASSHNRILYFQRLVEKTHKTVEPELIMKLYNAYWDTFLKNMVLKEGALETLKKLKKQDIKISLVSDLTTQIQLRKIHRLRLTSYIDHLVTSEEAGSEKPHAIMFLLALNKLDLLHDEVLFVGDSQRKDILGANATKIKTAWLTGKRKKKRNVEDYKFPNYYIKKIPEVLNIVEELNNKRG